MRLTHSAEADIDAILDFIAGRDGVEQTEALLRERLLREEEPLE